MLSASQSILRVIFCSKLQVAEVVCKSKFQNKYCGFHRHYVIDQPFMSQALTETDSTQFDTVLNGLRVALMRVTDDRICWANPSFYCLFGFVPSDVIGKKPRILFQTDLDIEEVERRSEPARDMPLLRAGAEVLWCRVNCDVSDPDAGGDGMIWSFADVGDQVAARIQVSAERDAIADALALQQTLLAKAQVGLMIAKNRTVAWGNQCFFDMIGYTREQMIGQSTLIYFADPDDFNRAAREGYPLLVVGKVYSTEVVLKGRGGRLIPCVVTGNAINVDNLDEGYIWSFADITDRIAAETREREALERERQAVEREHLETQKMDALAVVVAGVAHEINTPIGVGFTLVTHFQKKITEFAQMMGAGAMKRSDLQNFVDLSRDVSDQLSTSIKRAAELIKTFKLIAVDRSRGNQARFNLKNHLEDIVARLLPNLRNTPLVIEIQCADDIEMNSYPDALNEIISAFVMNSLTHAFDPGTAGSMIISAQRREAEIVLRFSDNGKGIPAEHLPKIFDPFFTTKRGAGGSGLGLSIVFNLTTRKLGGRVSCSSKEGEGTVFLLEMPLDVGLT